MFVLQQQQNLGQRFGASKMHLSLLVSWAAVRSKAFVLLLLIRCTLLYVHSSFCNHNDGEERAGCLALFVFLVSSDGC